MGIAVLVFGLLVGVFHFQAAEPDATQQATLSAAPEQPASYEASSQLAQTAAQVTAIDGQGVKRAKGVENAKGAEEATQQESFNQVVAPVTVPVARKAVAGNSYATLAAATNNQELAQAAADIIAAHPGRAGKVVTIALAQMYGESTLGDVATLAATATKAAPDQAPAIAGSVARSFRGQSEPALAAAVATIVSLVPEQSREIGLVVGAIIGENVESLGMVAQTVAIATGEETFSSLSEGSGVSMSALMKQSSSLGIKVPFDVPSYAAQLAPSATRVADGTAPAAEHAGDM